MAKRAEIVLDHEEREVLERWVRRPKSSQALAFRCRIVLAAAEGRSSTQIAAELGCNLSTVGRWRGRFAQRRLDGLHDEPRPGKPRSISDAEVERVIVKTLEEQPVDATHWSTRSMAAATGMSQSAISRIWRAFGLEPHRTETFKLSPDPQFVDKVRRHRRAVPQPAGGGGRALYRREVPDPGARPLGAGAAADARRARATHPRLRPPRHDQPVCGARCRLRASDLGDDASPPRRGVPPLLEPDRRSGARTPRRARRARTTPRPTRRPRSSAGFSVIRASRSTSHRPTPPGSTS